ncbi:MAG: hypothetical protein ACK5B9_10655 [Flavobacteriia bacterium]|jgi:hypothetical protein
MKSLNYILIFAVFSVAIFLITNSLSFDAQTGDKQFDEKLNEINKDALADLKAFKSNVANFYQIDETEVSNMMSVMEPAEIILAIEVAKLANKPLTEIVNLHRENKSLGWNKILLSIGIKKNSTEFNDLKQINMQEINQQETTISKK